ncbi:MAG: LemA family protein [Deltaproteobacteria bacterium]|nr:LemA family protein [Deltaproteobacteria bacterium]
MPYILVILGLGVVLALFFITLYNGLVRSRNEVTNAWSSIDVQLKRRHDLIPNLIETVKGYAAHERQTLDQVVRTRQEAAASTGSVEERAKAENALTQSLRSLFALAEAYPGLKANENFIALQEELATTENKIGFARQYYNDAAMRYKNRVEMFPSNMVAGMYNFQAEAFFQLEEAGERVVPKVKF